MEVTVVERSSLAVCYLRVCTNMYNKPYHRFKQGPSLLDDDHKSIRCADPGRISAGTA